MADEVVAPDNVSVTSAPDAEVTQVTATPVDEVAQVEATGEENAPTTPAPEAAAAPEAGPTDGITIPENTFDMNTYVEEFATSGEISTESREAITKAGIPSEMIDDYIAGQQARATVMAQQATAKAFELAGGEDAYVAATAWAETNLDAAAITKYNEEVNSLDAGRVEQAVSQMLTQYRQENGSEGVTIAGGTPSVPAGGDVYGDMTELQAALADPKYKSSQAFRTQVEEKVRRSLSAGTV